MGPDPEVGVGRGEESPIWDWKSLRSRDGAGGARPTVAGRKGRSSGPCAARLPARLPPSGSCLAGLSSRWVRGALGGRSCPGPDPRDPVPGRSRLWRNHGGCLSSPPLLSASLFTIWRPAFKLYFYSQRHFGCIYDLQTSPGERWGLPRGPFCGSSSGAGAGILPL